MPSVLSKFTKPEVTDKDSIAFAERAGCGNSTISLLHFYAKTNPEFLFNYEACYKL
jgi:hypothetical protein